MQDENIAQTSGREINDVFDDIFLSENRVFEESFKEGYEQGKKEENLEAYHLGYHRGAEFGTEIGYYIGVTDSYLQKVSGDDKIVKELATLKQLLVDFPNENDLETDILGLLNQIRAKFKKLCAVLKIHPSFPEPDPLSF